MKLLFDQNLSYRLVRILAEEFPGSTHVRSVGLDTADDRESWAHAADNGYIIVSKDADFSELSFVYGSPPKAIWLRVGNGSTARIADLLRRHAFTIKTFDASTDESFLVLGDDGT